MKRGGPLRRRKPLKRTGGPRHGKPIDPSKVARGNPPRRREAKRFPGANGWTRRVFFLYGRACLACPRRAPEPAVQAHHVVARRVIITAPHLDAEQREALAYDARNGLPVCKRCHERHETATERIPRARLRPEHASWAREHGFGHVIDDERLYP